MNNKNIFFMPERKEKRFFDFPLTCSNLSPLKQDTVSFKGKNYSMDKIKEPTGHCAYCGTKVYSHEQLVSLATELMKLKGTRLNGKIRSVLEKLDLQDSNTDIAVKKRQVNKEHISFFNKFSSFALNSGTETGMDLLLKYGGFKDEKEVRAEIMSHLKPMQKTIDHITPQRKGNENSDEDVNLVEACYCCNHDLKKGMDFRQFNSMYPSIEKNMPQYKYQCAMANILETSQEQVKAELSSQNLLQLLETLTLQRSQAVSTLDSVNLRFKKCFEDIRLSLQKSKQEKADKEKQIADLEVQSRLYSTQEEYVIRTRQISLSSEIKELGERKANIVSSMFRMQEQIDSPEPRLSKKQRSKQSRSQEEIKKQQEELRQKISLAQEDLNQTDSIFKQKKAELEELSSKYTPLESLIAEYDMYKEIINAYRQFEENKEEEQAKQKVLDLALKREEELKEIMNRPEPPQVKEADCSKEEVRQYGEYKKLIELINSMNNNRNNISEMSQKIYAHARNDVENQILTMLSNPLIDHAEYKRRQYIAKNKMQKAIADKNAAQSQFQKIQEEQKHNTDLMAQCTLEDAKKKSYELSKEIERVKGIHEDLKIVDRINTAKAELKLIETTISNLETALKKEYTIFPR